MRLRKSGFNLWPVPGKTYTYEGRRVVCYGRDVNDHVFVGDKDATIRTFYSVPRKELSP